MVSGEAPRILFVNPYGIGDVLFTTPAVSLVKKRFPRSRVGYLCNERSRVILESNPSVDKVFIFEKDGYRRLWRENRGKCLKQFVEFLAGIKKERFEAVLDYSLNRQYGFFLAVLGIPVRIGYDYRKRGIFLNQRVKINGNIRQPMAVFYCRLLKELGLTVDEKSIPPLQLPLAAETRQWSDRFLAALGLNSGDRFIAVHPGGGASWGPDALYKRWPAESFIRLVRILREHYRTRIFILGDASEAEIISSFTLDFDEKGIINLSGRLTLDQTAALLGRAWFAVCNDGGPLHLAVSQGTPTVSFFGPVDENIYGPFPREGHLVLTHPVECRPCYQNFKFPPCPYEHRCLKQLSVEEAFTRIQQVFKK
ncbi:MAG: glycosyltransferase family 9 protein [Candidatus Omnitrophica bacterium]|nr:glycosyltransferase family 9 protein [Candidatus Omnitrophota bacterium]